MVYVTHRYKVKEYETEEDAVAQIHNEMSAMTSKKIFDETKNGIHVMIFQWWTLYIEEYVISKSIDMRNSV